MDITSYLLGKKASGGGTDLSEYFVNSGFKSENGCNACIKKLPFEVDITGLTSIKFFCSNWNNLEEITIRNGENVTDVYGAFQGCTKLMFLDVRDIIFSNITSASYRANFFGNNMYGYVPRTCLIIVKDDTEKEWFATYFPSWTNVKTVAEYEAS